MVDSPIASVALYRVALPTRREHKWTGLTEPIGGYVIVKIADENGLAGWGEAPVLKDWGGEFGRYFGETPGTTVSVTTQYLAPAIRGCIPGEIAEIHERMSRAIKGFPYAKAALEFAAYDLAGKQCGLAVHRLLGGALRRKIPVTHSIGRIAMSKWCAGCGTRSVLQSRSVSTPIRATARSARRCVRFAAWSEAI